MQDNDVSDELEAASIIRSYCEEYSLERHSMGLPSWIAFILRVGVFEGNEAIIWADSFPRKWVN